ncbi:hypothetical protein ACTXT7_000269 [Hymenolepis weldensis]
MTQTAQMHPLSVVTPNQYYNLELKYEGQVFGASWFETFEKDLMPDTTITNEMKNHSVIVSLKAKHKNLEIARFLKVARSSICKVRKELLNENNGNGLGATRKRREHCQCSVSLRTPRFVRRVHGMIDENPGKSMRDIFLQIFKCLKEQ